VENETHIINKADMKERKEQNKKLAFQAFLKRKKQPTNKQTNMDRSIYGE